MTESRTHASRVGVAVDGEKIAARQTRLRAAAKWINRQAPEQRATILGVADHALEGRVVLSGSRGEPCFIGTPPAWQEIRTPDSHYGSDLNRMLHWPHLLKAYLLTHDQRYAHRVVLEALNWVEECPRPPLPMTQDDCWTFYGVSPTAVPWHCLNSGIRLFDSWRFMVEGLHGLPVFSDDTLNVVAWSMREQAEAIRAVSPRLFPDASHNHYLMEMLGVLSWASLFPDMPDATEWGRHAIAELERCALSQLTTDGAQIEGCPSYHSGCLECFSLVRQYARDCGAPLSPEVDALIRNAIRYAVYATRPSGEDVPWGDSHPGSGYLKSALNAHIAYDDLEPLSMAARFTGQEALRKACVAQAWNLPDIDGILTSISNARFPQDYPAWPRTEWQKDVKQVVMKTDWTAAATSVFFACYTPVHYGNHGHIDPCGFEFCALGRPLLIDPGCAAYFADETRRHIKSATRHNMLTVNFREPFDYCNSFSYAPQKAGNIDWVIDKPHLLAAQAQHACFEPAVYRRAVCLVGDRILLVLDAVESLYWLSSVQLYFQIPFATPLKRSGDCGFCTSDSGVNLIVVASDNLVFEQPPIRTEADASVGIERPFTTVRFDDWGTSQTTSRYYATLAYAVPDGEDVRQANITAPKVTEVVGGVAAHFSVSGIQYNVQWSGTGVEVKPSITGKEREMSNNANGKQENQVLADMGYNVLNAGGDVSALATASDVGKFNKCEAHEY